MIILARNNTTPQTFTSLNITQFEVTVVVSFLVSIVAIILAQWFWTYLTGPKITLTAKGLDAPNTVNNFRYFKIGIKNTGATAARSTLVRVKVKEVGPNNKEVEVIPKWDATPEASIAGNKFLYDSYQRINIPPGGAHEELVPIMIVSPSKPPNNKYKSCSPYLFSNVHFFIGNFVDVELIKDKVSGSIDVDSENCYVRYRFEISIIYPIVGNPPCNYTITFTKLEPEVIKWWLFPKGRVGNPQAKI